MLYASRYESYREPRIPIHVVITVVSWQNSIIARHHVSMSSGGSMYLKKFFLTDFKICHFQKRFYEILKKFDLWCWNLLALDCRTVGYVKPFYLCMCCLFLARLNIYLWFTLKLIYITLWLVWWLQMFWRVNEARLQQSIVTVCCFS